MKAVANDIEVKPGTSHTDPEIIRDTLQAMKINVAVPDEKIKVTARDGFLTLEGTVEWQYQLVVNHSAGRVQWPQAPVEQSGLFQRV